MEEKSLIDEITDDLTRVANDLGATVIKEGEDQAETPKTIGKTLRELADKLGAIVECTEEPEGYMQWVEEQIAKRKGRRRKMNFKPVLILAVILMLPIVAMADGGKDTAKSYYQYGPDNKVQQPASLWNPIVSVDKKTGEVHKSFFQHQPSQTFPAGSLFNPLITTTEKEPSK